MVSEHINVLILPEIISQITIVRCSRVCPHPAHAGETLGTTPGTHAVNTILVMILTMFSVSAISGLMIYDR